MGTSFLTDFAAESGSTPYSTAQSLVSTILAAPFFTDVSEHCDHSWKLHKALKYAEDCQVPVMSRLSGICVCMITGFAKTCPDSFNQRKRYYSYLLLKSCHLSSVFALKC